MIRMQITTAEITSITGGSLYGSGNIVISDLITDSRNISLAGPATLFIAIAGKRNDGHDFIPYLRKLGVRAFLVTDDSIVSEMEVSSDDAFILVEDSVQALQEIALFERNCYQGEVIAVTGIAGKTIVKEWLAEVISHFTAVYRSPGSYNSGTGVPLSLSRIGRNSQYAVIEAGISQPGEMARLARIIRPDIGIFTNIDDTPQEDFILKEEKCREKSLLFRSCRLIVVSEEDKLVNRILDDDSFIRGKKIFRWSISETTGADILIIPEREDDSGTWCTIIWREKSYDLNIPFSDRASVENAITVVAASAALGLEMEKVAEVVRGLTPVTMLMEKKKGINNCVIIGDYYYSDPGSLARALDYLWIERNKKKSLILSDVMRSGREIDEIATEIVRLTERAGVTRIICVGEKLGSVRELFPENTLFFNDSRSLISWFRPDHFRDEAILIKGARLFGFEEIGSLLEQQTHITRLEINLVRVLENINYHRSFLKPGTKMMAMIKAFAYGVGQYDMADWLNYNGIDFLTVAFIDEGVDLRRAGVKGRIVVMSPDKGSFKLLLKFNLEPELYSTDMVRLFLNEAAINELVDYPVHIKFDTGMHRLGMDEDELPELTKLLLNNSNVRVVSVFSHLGSSERADHDHHTLRQAATFERMTHYLQDKLGYNFMRHLLNSTGIERFPQFQYDMVRIGIGLYTDHSGSSGVDEPSVRLRTEVTQVKKVKGGEGIGYGFTDISTNERTIAVIPVGYADGLPRSIGEGRGVFTVKGIRVPVTGNICMDMCMIDVTGYDVAVGDEVEIFGKNISLQEVADQWETITHNVLTGISQRVKRIFFY